MPKNCDHRHKSRKSIKKANHYPPEQQYPNVTFDGSQSIEIPADNRPSPVQTHLSLLSNPTEFKYLDEIALLKRGRIDKDAPKHPYNRNLHHPEKNVHVVDVISDTNASSRSSSCDSSSRSSKTDVSAISFLAEKPISEKVYKIGSDGLLKWSKLKKGGERIELTAGKMLAVLQQEEGQTTLVTHRL